MNTLIVIGHLGKDPEKKDMGNDRSVANMTLAVNMGKDQNGADKPTQWMKVALWYQTSKPGVVPFLAKGAQICVSGTPTAEAWLKDGVAVAAIRIDTFGNGVTLCGKKADAPAQPTYQAPEPSGYNTPPPPAPTQNPYMQQAPPPPPPVAPPVVAPVAAQIPVVEPAPVPPPAADPFGDFGPPPF